MPFFDFHLHPTLKSLFSEQTATTQKFSPWERLRKETIPLALRWCSEFEYIIQSQSNLRQLLINDCNLVCVALYIPERRFLDNSLVQQGAQSSLKTYLQEAKIQQIINGNPYALLMNDDWLTLTDAAQFGVTDKKVKPLRLAAEYKETDTDTLHVVFTAEGCHVFMDKLGVYDKDTIIQNLDDLRSKLSLLSINLTHIEQSTVCNHAFGMQFVEHIDFVPRGNRNSADGIAITKHCYDHNIMVDVKHMSLAARLHLYELRNSGALGTNLPPIVATHVGFTGISVQQIPDYILDYKRYSNGRYTMLLQGKPVKYYTREASPCFNASSINLYDEDIMAILQSGGMIGISLDKRILGYQQYNPRADYDFPVEKEYVSYAEEDLFLPSQQGAEIGNAFLNEACMDWEEVRNGGTVYPQLGDYHLRHFMAHIVHVIAVARNNNYDVRQALKQLCIGSDMDGMINPMYYCMTYDDIYYLQQAFEKQFVSFAKEVKVKLPAGFDVKAFSQDLFFRNGRDFVLGRLGG